MDAEETRLQELLRRLRNLRIQETETIQEIEQLLEEQDDENGNQHERQTSVEAEDREGTENGVSTAHTDVRTGEQTNKVNNKATTRKPNTEIRNDPHSWKRNDEVYIQNRITIRPGGTGRTP